MKYTYNRHAATETAEKLELEKLGDFLYLEAELAAEAGRLNSTIPNAAGNQRNPSSRNRSQDVRLGATYFTKNIIGTNENQTKKFFERN